MFRLVAALFFLLSLCAPFAATANTVCVGTATELQNALTAAQARTEDTLIEIKSGTYHGGFTFAGSGNTTLTIRGGYADFFGKACGTEQGETILDASLASPVLDVETSFPNVSGDILLERLTFTRGTAAAGQIITASALTMWLHSGFTGSVTVDRCSFISNTSHGNWGAVNIALNGGGRVSMLNNTFIGNSSDNRFPAAALFTTGVGVVINNTVTRSSTTGTSSAAAFWIDPRAGSAIVANNIFVNSFGTPDFQTHPQMFLVNNDIGAIVGVAPAYSSGNISADPIFIDELGINLRLSPASPLIDAGNDAPPGGLPSVDHISAARIDNAHVDIGAYESTSDRIFFSNLDITYF